MCCSNTGRADDLLPEVVCLEVAAAADADAGEAIVVIPGTEVQASGFVQHGTVSCNFSWLRISDDGAVTTIQGADSATYQVSDDDVEFYVAVRVQPVDSRGRKGEVVQAFANGGRKIGYLVEI
ncbi:hypothetical protein LINPERPRIM_LOCUS28254 [Linum perenne]